MKYEMMINGHNEFFVYQTSYDGKIERFGPYVRGEDAARKIAEEKRFDRAFEAAEAVNSYYNED